MLIDTHCHLDFPEFASDKEEVIKRALEAGVERFINVSSSWEGCRASVELAGSHKEIYAALGVHPHHASEVNEELTSRIEQLAQDCDKVVAIGEVGLDYFRNLSPAEDQRLAFRYFIKLAQRLNLALILHSRDAAKDTLKVLDEEYPAPARGVIHCFSAGEKYLKQFLNRGLYVSFTLNITYPNARRLVEVLRACPAEKLLLETDCPFLPPQQYRGKRCEPAYVRILTEEIARIKGMSFEEVARITTENARKLFGIQI